MTAETDAFWGLETAPSGSVRVAPGDDGAPRVRLEPGDAFGIAELAADVPVTVPGLRCAAGEPLVQGRLESGELVALAARAEDGSLALGFDPDAAVRSLTTRAALTAKPPTSARLPFHYHRIPPRLRSAVRNALVLASRRRGGGSAFPSWPVEPSVEVLRRIHLGARRHAEPGLEPRELWPGGKRFALVLTHDIDSAEGVRVAADIGAAEREHGLRSCWYIVGADWPFDHDRLGALAADGHELGLHDAHHDNRGPFLDPAELGARLDACRPIVERYRMTGYRSPSMLRSEAMYAALDGRFAYDSSMPDAGLYPRPNGCATVFPLRRGAVPVLPLTLPPDGQLLATGLGPDGVVDAWIRKAEWVARAGGVAMLLTHPEPGFSASPEMQRAYRRFLEWAAGRDDAWHALPAEVAAHWAARQSA